jgi:hypothetical protein
MTKTIPEFGDYARVIYWKDRAEHVIVVGAARVDPQTGKIFVREQDCGANHMPQEFSELLQLEAPDARLGRVPDRDTITHS